MQQTQRRLHLIGAGGSGLSSLASYLLQRGDEVTGFDAKESLALDSLRAQGARIPVAVEELDDVDEVIHTAALGAEHPELVAARTRGIPTGKYAEFLGREIADMRGLAVAGTHGKTTTAGFLAHILTEAGLDPCAVMGGYPRGWRAPGRFGRGRLFVVEACEYDRSFLQLRPRAAIITNVEADHLDYYGDEASLREAFHDFLALLPMQGPVIIHESAASALDLSRVGTRCVIVGEGKGVTDQITPLTRPSGLPTATLRVLGKKPVLIAPSLPGRHNLANAALAASMALRVGVREERVELAIRSFQGMSRRLEPLGRRQGRLFFSDYAHHPTEIRAVREALRERWPERRLLVVYQPHQASRTAWFRDRFADELSRFDDLILPGIFSVREDGGRVAEEERLLSEALQRRGCLPTEVDGLGAVMNAVFEVSREGDVVVLMGAGNIDELADPMRVRAKEAAGV